MKTVGIISEYNPFHNGHRYHITETKKQLDADFVIAMMSGNFTQRGEVALFDMYSRAEVAVKNGVDLVLEIPPQFVLHSAEFYAYYGVYLLHQLGIVDYLSFGSECGDLTQLAQCENRNVIRIKEQMKTGVSYAKAISDSSVSKTPNNILGIEYLRALRKIKSNIIPFTVKRNSVNHGSLEAYHEFASASLIRNMILTGNSVSAFVPELPNSTPSLEEQLFPALKYRLIIGQEENLSNINNISEGLQNRILANRDASSFAELISKVKCKRYPETRIRRALYSILLNLQKSDDNPTYTRVLAHNENGRKILRKMKNTSCIPIFSKITKKDLYEYPQLQKELLCNELFKTITNKCVRNL